MSFRSTCRQAIGRGAYVGSLAGLVTCFGLAVLRILGVQVHVGASPQVTRLLPVVPIGLGLVVGGLLGLVFCRPMGVIVDDLGIRTVRRRHGGHVAWRFIDDLRAERRGGRTRVAVYSDDGQLGWLQAPYSGRLLAADPEFERKLFMLRNVLATHRSFALTDFGGPVTPAQAAPGRVPSRRRQPGRVTTWPARQR